MTSIVRNNTALQVKQMIERLSTISYPVQSFATSCVRNLIALQAVHDVLPDFPTLDASVDANGQFIKDLHDNCDSVMDNYNPNDYFILGGGTPDAHYFRQVMTDEEGIMYEGATEFITFMVNSWLENANQYQDNRVKSARLQLLNEGVSPEQVEELVAQPLALRTYIHQQRAALLAKLTSIKVKIDSNDALNLATKTEIALYAKHQAWFEGDDVADDEYYPNDSAVHYPALLMEIVAMVSEGHHLTLAETYDVVVHFVRIMHGSLHSQGARDAWVSLGTCPSSVIHGVDVGPIVRSYVMDGSRNIGDGDKLSGPLGRSPLRMYRIACNFFGLPGQFSLLNAPDDEFMEAAIKMYRDELQIKTLSADTTFIKKGAEGLFVSTACAWLKALQRDLLVYAITGRNDLSVPKLVGSLVNVSMDLFPSLPPREWALDHSIRGLDEDAPSVEDAYNDISVATSSDEESNKTPPVAPEPAMQPSIAQQGPPTEPLSAAEQIAALVAMTKTFQIVDEQGAPIPEAGPPKKPALPATVSITTPKTTKPVASVTKQAPPQLYAAVASKPKEPAAASRTPDRKQTKPTLTTLGDKTKKGKKPAGN